jgi:hypothetical protein
MKAKLSTHSLYAFVALAVAGGCKADGRAGGEAEQPRRSSLRQSAAALPARPALGPGQSNWRPRDAARAGGDSVLACPSIGTVDLTLTTPETLVATLLGGGPAAPLVSNVQFTGADVAAGLFDGGTGPIGFEDGVILSSGNVASVAGPNASDNVTTNNGQPGDADLDGLIPGFTTFDASILEFDFECPGANVLSFRYVFTSDEYNEFVDTAFNDVFGFFVNGSNVALIPGTATPVAINNVNCGNPFSPPGGANCDKFINNDLSDGGGGVCTEMDGLTVVFTANAPVQPGLNHIRLAVGDAGDSILDSNIFLERGSFTCNSPPVAKCRDVTAKADATCDADASIDDGSFDPDGDPLTCEQSPAGPYGLGTTEVTLTCTDPAGASSSCTGVVTVVDATPPTVTSAGGGELWPPNHHYVVKTLDDCGVQINDQCQGLIDLDDANPAITCVTSDEVENGAGDGDTLADMVIVDATTVKLRSERSDSKDGRVYRIHFKVSDAAGNLGDGACVVTVPRNQSGGGAAVDSGVHFTVGTCN